MRISIGKAANILGVSKQTLRRWETQGKIKVLRTPQNHRRYEISSIHGFSKKPTLDTEKITIGYARVSSHDQKSDLITQAQLLESYMAKQGATEFPLAVNEYAFLGFSRIFSQVSETPSV